MEIAILGNWQSTTRSHLTALGKGRVGSPLPAADCQQVRSGLPRQRARSDAPYLPMFVRKAFSCRAKARAMAPGFFQFEKSGRGSLRAAAAKASPAAESRHSHFSNVAESGKVIGKSLRRFLCQNAMHNLS